VAGRVRCFRFIAIIRIAPPSRIRLEGSGVSVHWPGVEVVTFSCPIPGLIKKVSAIGSPLPPINVGLIVKPKNAAVPAPMHQSTMFPLLLVEKDISAQPLMLPNSAAALGSVEEKEKFPSASPIVHAVREDNSSVKGRLGARGAAKEIEAIM
jgi:hypothetical protein